MFRLWTLYHGHLKKLLIALSAKFDVQVIVLWDGGHIKFWSRRTLTSLLDEKGVRVEAFMGAGRFPYLWKSMMLASSRWWVNAPPYALFGFLLSSSSVPNGHAGNGMGTHITNQPGQHAQVKQIDKTCPWSGAVVLKQGGSTGPWDQVLRPIGCLIANALHKRCTPTFVPHRQEESLFLGPQAENYPFCVLVDLPCVRKCLVQPIL
jgi:hypothetical protein